MAAIDELTGTVYIYDEHYQAGKGVQYHANKMNEMMASVPPGLLRQPVGDPSGAQRNKTDMRSLFNHYAEYGIFFKPGNNRIEDGVQKVYTYLSLGKLKIFRTCANTVREGTEYKYKVHELDSNKGLDEKPVGKDDHTMDTLRYLIQELPDDPERLKNKSVNPREMIVVSNQEEKHLPFELQDNEEDYNMEDWYYNY